MTRAVVVRSVLGLAVLGGLAVSVSAAEVARTIAYQGQLDLDGAAYTGNVQVRFRLYTDGVARNGDDCAADPVCAWEESHPAVQVFGGHFSARLGASVGGLEPLLRQDRQYYIELAVRDVPGEGEDVDAWTRLANRQALSLGGQAAWSLHSVPPTAVMAFNRNDCPAGWRRYHAGDGRVIVGRSDGARLGAQVGSPLGPQEDRVVLPRHNHGVSDPGHTHLADSPPHTHPNEVSVRDLGHTHDVHYGGDHGGAASPENGQLLQAGGNRAGGRAIRSGGAAANIRTTVNNRAAEAEVTVGARVTGLSVNHAGVANASTASPYVQLTLCEKN